MSFYDEVPVLNEIIKPGNKDIIESTRRSSYAAASIDAQNTRIESIIEKHLAALRRELRSELLGEQ